MHAPVTSPHPSPSTITFNPRVSASFMGVPECLRAPPSILYPHTYCSPLAALVECQFFHWCIMTSWLRGNSHMIRLSISSLVITNTLRAGQGGACTVLCRNLNHLAWMLSEVISSWNDNHAQNFHVWQTFSAILLWWLKRRSKHYPSDSTRPWPNAKSVSLVDSVSPMTSRAPAMDTDWWQTSVSKWKESSLMAISSTVMNSIAIATIKLCCYSTTSTETCLCCPWHTE